LTTLYPRIHPYIPCSTLVEIAPGYGRWTKFLLSRCQKYYGFDISPKCIDSCRQNFSNANHAQFFLTNGTSLPEVPNHTCDFLFSFDSLVHAELEVILAYIPEILRVLSPQGVAFIHHSNWADTPRNYENIHCRATSVSAPLVATAIEQNGGRVLIQEKISWQADQLLDCLTLFTSATHPSLSDHAEPILLENRNFSEQAGYIRSFIDTYYAHRRVKK
jgi:ubiquinone/menaquinone biosynthesis C-methylase UbiE